MANLRVAFSLVVLASFFAGPAPAAEPNLKDVLSHEIIGPNVAMEEVQAYTEANVPPMPQVSSAEEWQQQADLMRHRVLERVVYRGEAARWRDAITRVEWLETIEGGHEYSIRKLRYEVLPGLWIPALLYEPHHLAGKVPAVLNVNGHDGQGKAVKYKQIRCINQAKRGMLALNVEWFGMGQLRGENFSHARMNQLDLCGTSGLAPFYLAMKRGLDILLSLPHADPERIAVTGLSGGGWQTITISSLDTRVKLCDPVAGYSSFRTRARFLSDLGDSEQTPTDLGSIADYAQLTAMLAPRPALLTFNDKDDCCFATDHALQPLLDAARPIFKLYGKEQNLRYHTNSDPGTHNYEIDNRQAFYRMLGDFFYSAESFDPAEIPCDDEVKSADQLNIPLPADNADFHSLALEISKELPRDAELPATKAAAEKWQQDRRSELAQIVRLRHYDATAEATGTDEHDGVHVRYLKLKVGNWWTVPAVELTRGEPKATAVLVADAGRAAAAEHAQRLLDAGHRVLAVDPFYFGESKIAQRDYLFALMVTTIGDRPLGLQAGQLSAIARWAQKEYGGKPVSIVADGPRSSLFSLVAAAVEPAVSAVELHGSFGSLKEVIEQNGSVDKTPELFCFGLLERFDIPQLAALVAPRPVRLNDPSQRARQELAPLKQWYVTLGAQFDPVP